MSKDTFEKRVANGLRKVANELMEKYGEGGFTQEDVEKDIMLQASKKKADFATLQQQGKTDPELQNAVNVIVRVLSEETDDQKRAFRLSNMFLKVLNKMGGMNELASAARPLLTRIIQKA